MSRSDSDPDLVVPALASQLRIGTLDRATLGRGTIDRRTLDSACSAETGENVYSRINDTGRLELLLSSTLAVQG